MSQTAQEIPDMPEDQQREWWQKNHSFVGMSDNEQRHAINEATKNEQIFRKEKGTSSENMGEYNYKLEMPKPKEEK